MTAVRVVGGGLAGSEAAWQLAERGIRVELHEMRPVRQTPAHHTDRFAELVCSNTFKSTEVTNAHGLLKAEMRALGSLILECADEARVQAGSALAVDRDVFSAAVPRKVYVAPPSVEIAIGKPSSSVELSTQLSVTELGPILVNDSGPGAASGPPGGVKM